MPSLHGGKKRKSTRGRKSPGRKVSRKSPGRKVSRKSGRKSRRVRGGKMEVIDYAQGAGYMAAAGDVGRRLGQYAGKAAQGSEGQNYDRYGSYIGAGVGALGAAGAQYLSKQK